MPQVQEEEEESSPVDSSISEGQCAPPHTSNHVYSLHDIVSVNNSNYECYPTPNPHSWCNHVTD